MGDVAVYKAKLNPEVYKRRTVDDPAVKITKVAEGIEEETERVNTSRYDKTDSMKIHHASLKIVGHNCDDNAVPYMKKMQQSRTCERNSWTTTSMVLENQYSQLLQLNKELFDCNECEYISRRTTESKEHPQDHQCKKYKLSHRTDIESVDKLVSSSKDEKKNNNAVSINVPATTYSLDFTRS